MILIVVTTVFGARTGSPVLADGEAGLIFALALAVYLVLVGAGRALVGIVAVLGVCLAFHAPQAAAGVVLAERGRVESAVVTSVHGGGTADGGHGRCLCEVADRKRPHTSRRRPSRPCAGVPLRVRIWRGCEQNTRPGDALAVVYDPRGMVPPRGVDQDTSALGALRGLSGWAGALVAVSVVAVVRSHRLSVPPPDRVSVVRG